MKVLNSVDNLLGHIRDVQEDIISLSSKSLLNISTYIEENNLEVDDNILAALQYQDIITQQLTAIIEAIDTTRSSMNRFSHAHEEDEKLVKNSVSKLEEKLDITLKEAKDKKDRFSGKVVQNHEQNDEIEFF
jgi:vacuolar-type H+-ATPase subunit I/STV1